VTRGEGRLHPRDGAADVIRDGRADPFVPHRRA
jgi:hypothetical protein